MGLNLAQAMPTVAVCSYCLHVEKVAISDALPLEAAHVRLASCPRL